MSRPDPPDGTLWTFEQGRDQYVYVTDIDWEARRVHYTTFDAHQKQNESDMLLGPFSKWVAREDVYEIPV